MTSAEIPFYIRKAFEIFKRNIVKIILFAILVYVPVSLMQLMLPDLDMSGMTQASLPSYYEKLLILLLATVLLSLISGIFDMTVIYFVREADKPLNVPFSEAFDFALRTFPKYLATRAIGYLIGFALAMLCFLPGIIALFLFSLSPYLVVLREVWGRRALKESALLVRKNALFLIIVLLIQYAAIYFLSFCMSMAMVLLNSLKLNSLAVNVTRVVSDVVIYTVLSLVTIFIALITQRMISSTPELDKVPGQEQ